MKKTRQKQEAADQEKTNQETKSEKTLTPRAQKWQFCHRGHPRSTANTYFDKSGFPVCRVCNRERAVIHSRTLREQGIVYTPKIHQTNIGPIIIQGNTTLPVGKVIAYRPAHVKKARLAAIIKEVQDNYLVLETVPSSSSSS